MSNSGDTPMDRARRVREKLSNLPDYYVPGADGGMYHAVHPDADTIILAYGEEERRDERRRLGRPEAARSSSTEKEPPDCGLLGLQSVHGTDWFSAAPAPPSKPPSRITKGKIVDGCAIPAFRRRSAPPSKPADKCRRCAAGHPAYRFSNRQWNEHPPVGVACWSVCDASDLFVAPPPPTEPSRPAEPDLHQPYCIEGVLEEPSRPASQPEEKR